MIWGDVARLKRRRLLIKMENFRSRNYENMKTYPLYLNGVWHVSSPFQQVINPSNGESLGQVSTLGRARVAEAISDAHEAFKSWRKLTGKVRGDFLLAIATEVEKRKDDIARTITLENGKPLALQWELSARLRRGIFRWCWLCERWLRRWLPGIPLC